MSYRQITQAEAREQGLTGHCLNVLDLDGNSLHYHPPTRLWWKDAADLSSTPPPPWKGGLPNPRA